MLQVFMTTLPSASPTWEKRKLGGAPMSDNREHGGLMEIYSAPRAEIPTAGFRWF